MRLFYIIMHSDILKFAYAIKIKLLSGSPIILLPLQIEDSGVINRAESLAHITILLMKL